MIHAALQDLCIVLYELPKPLRVDTSHIIEVFTRNQQEGHKN